MFLQFIRESLLNGLKVFGNILLGFAVVIGAILGFVNPFGMISIFCLISNQGMTLLECIIPIGWTILSVIVYSAWVVNEFEKWKKNKI